MHQETELAFLVSLLLLQSFKTLISFPPKSCPMTHVPYLERASSVSLWLTEEPQVILLSLGTAQLFLALRQGAKQKRTVAKRTLTSSSN